MARKHELAREPGQDDVASGDEQSAELAVQRQSDGDPAHLGAARRRHDRTRAPSPDAAGSPVQPAPCAGDRRNQPAPDASSPSVASAGEAFQRQARLARNALRVAIAQITLLEPEADAASTLEAGAQRYPSVESRMPVWRAFCDDVARAGEPLFVEDARAHAWFREREPELLACAGVPIMTQDGRVLGSFCVGDPAARAWREDDVETLRDLAAAAATQIELRAAVAEAERQRRDKLTLLESTGEGVYGIDRAGRCTFVNRAAAEMLGYAVEELLGRNMHRTIHYAHADGAPYDERECPIERALRSGRGARVDDEVLWRRDGASFPASYSSFPVVEGGAVTGAVVAFSDMTARMRIERRLEVQHAVSRLLVEHSSIEAAAVPIVRAIAEIMRWQLGVLWLVDDELGAMRCSASWHAPNIEAEPFEAACHALTFVPGEGLPGRVWISGSALWLTDLQADENFPRRTAAMNAGLSSAVAFPIRGGGDVLGVVEYFGQRIRDPDDDLLRTLTAVGHQLGQFIERRHAESAVRANEERKAAMFEVALDAIISVDASGAVTGFNPAAERMFGYARSEVLGRHMADLLIPPGLRELHERGFARYLATGRVSIMGRRVELAAMRSDGSEFPVELEITRMPGAGRPEFTAFVRDIAERRQMRDLRRRRSREARLRADVGLALAGAGTLGGMLRRCCEAVVTHLDAALAHVWTLDEADHVLELAAASGPEPPVSEARTRIPVGAFRVGRVASERTPRLSNDLLGSLEPGDLDSAAASERIVAFAGYPLMVEDRIVGVLALYARESLADDTLDALASIADSIAQGIERKRVEMERTALFARERLARGDAEEANARLQALQTVSDTALSHLKLDDLLPELLGRVRQVLRADNVVILLLSEDGRYLTVRAVRGLEEEVAFGMRVPFGRGVAGRIAASRQPMIVDDLSQVEVYSPFLRERLRSLVGVPLIVEDRVVGVLHVGTAERHRFTQDDADLLRLVAERVALAIEHANLFEAERAARASAESAQARLAFLADASIVLAASLDYPTTLNKLASLVVPHLADWCAIHLLSERGEIERLAVAHGDPEKGRLASEMRALGRRALPEGHPLREVLRTGRPKVIPHIGDELLAASFSAPEQLRLSRTLGLRSTMIVPLESHGRVLGAITLVTGESGRRYGADDLALVEELARRAAAAVENAQLFRRTQDALQQVEAIAAELSRKAAELDTIIEAIPDGVYVCDASGMRTHVNAHGAALLGLSVEEALVPIAAYASTNSPRYPEGAPLPVEDFPLSRALRGEVRTDIRFVITQRETGAEVHLLASCAPIRDATGAITGAVSVCTDVTELTRLERQKDDFLSVASHEMKTPLTSLKILTQLTHRSLARAGVAETQHTARMERSILRMERLVNDLLDASRIESGRLALRLEQCDLALICRQVADEQMAATDRDITLRLPREPVLLEADPDRIGQVLANLLSNALKYSSSDCDVLLTLRRKDARAVLAVRDEGAGIPAESLPHLFERFYRVPGVQVQSGSGVGLGLGLFITREIVERHGGIIEVSSAVGQGTTFTVSLPLRG